MQAKSTPPRRRHPKASNQVESAPLWTCKLRFREMPRVERCRSLAKALRYATRDSAKDLSASTSRAKRAGDLGDMRPRYFTRGSAAFAVRREIEASRRVELASVVGVSHEPRWRVLVCDTLRPCSTRIP